MTVRKMRITVIAVVVALSGTVTAVGLADTSPGGHDAAPWPTGWTSYTFRDGTPVTDPAGDASPGYTDLVTGPSGDDGTLLVSFDRENLFFRLRLADDPKRTATDFSSAVWMVALGVNGTFQGAVGLNGKPPAAQTEFVYVIDADGSTVTRVYEDPFTDGPTNNSQGVRAIEQDADGNWFLDFQVPLQVIYDASGVEPGDRIQFFAGTSTANDLGSINKDWMVGDQLNFTGLGARQLAGARMRMAAMSELVAGTDPPHVAAPSQYDLTLRIRNPGLNSLTNLVVTDAIAPGVTIDAVSGDGTISAVGSAVTWEPPDVSPGMEAIARITVTVTPTLDDLGLMIPLDTGALGLGADAATGQAMRVLSAIAEVGPVQAVSGVSVTKEFALGPSTAGGAAVEQFVVSAANTGGSFLTDVEINDDVDAALTILTTNCVDLGGLDLTTGNTVSCGGLSLDPGAALKLEVLYQVAASVDSGFVENTATLNAAELAVSLSSGLAVLEVIEDVDLAVAKAFSATSVPAGAVGNFFTISVTNNGASSADQVVISDVVDSRLKVTAVIATLGDCADSDGDPSTVECLVSTLNQGESAVVVVVFDLTATAVEGSVIDNEAQASSDETSGPALSPIVSMIVAEHVSLPPTANDDEATTVAGTAVTIVVLANDADPEGDALEVRSVTVPGSGTATINVGGTVTYTPAAGFVGQESFSYEVCESETVEGLCDSANVTVTVTPGV